MSTALTLRGPSAVRMRFLAGLVSLPNALAIGTVTTTAAGTPATATITGTAPSQVLNLTVPKGDQGAPGAASTVPGPANSLAIGTVSTGAGGTAASATITGSAPSQTLNLVIPRGQDGTGAVNSVAGRGGNVVLTKSDVGLDQVDNTSDVNKPVSTAQAAADANRLRYDAAQSILATGRAQLLVNLGLVGLGPLPFAGTAAPSGTMFCYGQLLSRTTYSALFAAIGITYGAGDGSTTFALPDMRGRTAVGKDDMGGTAAARLTSGVSGIAATTLGAAGGDQALHAHAHGVTDPGHTHGVYDPGHRHPYQWDPSGGPGPSLVTSGYGGNGNVSSGTILPATTGISIYGSGTGISVNTTGTGGAQNVQPSLVTNYIIVTG